MTLAELKARFRREEHDDVAPYLWSDTDLVAWINEAENEACRRALLLVDSTTAAAKVTFLAGAVGITLPASVIFVRRAALASNNIPMMFRVARTMDEEVPGWEGASASTPRVAVPDWQTGYLRFYPPALAAGTVNMTVVRTPAAAMSADSDVPEIRAQYHSYLLDWVKFRAYGVQDTEVFDPKKSAMFEAAFIHRFGDTSAVNEHWALEQYYDIGHN